ncbi:MAG TPA: flavodoxin domain-containing protein [Levilinea sp.]|nr:flavodoxin domain-containing protein [Levilinea sp.]
MKILVVYDSYFGNTEKIAAAIGDALTSSGQVEVARISTLSPAQLQGVQMLVVGSPTRAFQPSDATKAFLKNLGSKELKSVKVAAFDTRVDVARVNSAILTFMVKLFGYAAEPIARSLQKKGGVLVGKPAGFFVKGKEGPLEEGELERAAAWAKQLV